MMFKLIDLLSKEEIDGMRKVAEQTERQRELLQHRRYLSIPRDQRLLLRERDAKVDFNK